MPIAGDVQLKVGQQLYTLTSQDTSLDTIVAMPDMTKMADQAAGANYAATLHEMTQNIQKMSSPYRAYIGPKATSLLREMVRTNEPIKLRTVGVNAQTSTTGEFTTGPTFSAALQKCGIAF